MLKRMQVPSKNLEIVYEDPWLSVINKPAGMLSVPGKEDAVSVYSLMREQYPEADSPLTVHRLDMATSGLMLIAKTKRVHQNLQASSRTAWSGNVMSHCSRVLSQRTKVRSTSRFA